MIPLFSIALSACLAVGSGSDHVLARDLSAAWPELAAIDPSTPLAYAPAPGVSRVFHAADLHQLAVRFSLPPAPDHEICVVRPVSPLDPDRMLEAMRRTLPDARIEIVDRSRQPAPEGDLEFPLTGLHNGALWNGSVRYAGNRRFAVWARVKVLASLPRVVALADLPPDRPVDPSQVKLETRDEFPLAGNFASTLDQVTGKWPRIAIRAGAEIRTDQLVEPRDVSRGQVVKVEVTGTAAHLECEGIAESSGARGEMISVRNRDSGRRFRARVTGSGRVSVDATLAKVTS